MCLCRESTSKRSGQREQTAIGKDRVSAKDDFCNSWKKGVDGGIRDEEGGDAGGGKGRGEGVTEVGRSRFGDDDGKFTVFVGLLEECFDCSRVAHGQDDFATSH